MFLSSRSNVCLHVYIGCTSRGRWCRAMYYTKFAIGYSVVDRPTSVNDGNQLDWDKVPHPAFVCHICAPPTWPVIVPPPQATRPAVTWALCFTTCKAPWHPVHGKTCFMLTYHARVNFDRARAFQRRLRGGTQEFSPNFPFTFKRCFRSC